MEEHRSPALKRLAAAQGAFYVLTGIWPLLSPSTFQKVTGPKVDFWLVNTVGVLIATIGSVLSLASMRRRITPEISLLALGSALGLAGIDIVYALRRRISPIYLLDALVELGISATWIALRDQDGGTKNIARPKTKEPAQKLAP